MCGIAGIWNRINARVSPHAIESMTQVLAHRGPDASGHWTNENGLYLGHRRLSIIDLDERSNQPFLYNDEVAITFNGEIYNYLEIKEQLSTFGYHFSTSSDTEVICAAYLEWGTECLKHFDGMFAFALYDSKKEQLFCARDRFGEKPFFYAMHEGVLYFASEMKALWEIGLPRKMRKKMIYHFLVNDLVEDVSDLSKTFYEGVFKLKGSHYMLIENGILGEQIQYYTPSIETTFTGTFEEATEKFYSLFEQSVQLRMRSDVAIGSSLSGGLDSSSISAMMNKQQHSNYTFSAKFDGFVRDEAKYIDQVSSFFQTKQVDCYPNELGVIQNIDSLIHHQDEPFQSGSIYAQFEVYKLARSKNCIVLLDGQGADEYLAGYLKFIKTYLFQIKETSKRNSFIDRLKFNQNIEIAPTFREKLQVRNPRVFQLFSQLKGILPGLGRVGVNRKFYNKFHQDNPFKTFSTLKETLRYNLINQGLEKLLRFSDRNAMAHSIEVRLPFLSHHLIDFIFSLPDSYFLHDGWTKSILRHAMKDELPESITWRKDKIGFEAPHETWMKQRDLAERALVAKENLIKAGYINTEYNQQWKILVLDKLRQKDTL